MKLVLDMNPDGDLLKKYGAKIKAVGGFYSACRGFDTRRYVTIPMPEGAEIVDAILKEFVCRSLVVRAGPVTFVASRPYSAGGAVNEFVAFEKGRGRS